MNFDDVERLKARDTFLFYPIPTFPRARKTGYAPVKNWLRSYCEPGCTHVHLIGEREFFKYREPSERWTREIQRILGHHQMYSPIPSHVLALGVAREISSGGETVPVILVELYNTEEWIEFQRLFKPLMVVVRYYAPERRRYS